MARSLVVCATCLAMQSAVASEALEPALAQLCRDAVQRRAPAAALVFDSTGVHARRSATVSDAMGWSSDLKRALDAKLAQRGANDVEAATRALLKTYAPAEVVVVSVGYHAPWGRGQSRCTAVGRAPMHADDLPGPMFRVDGWTDVEFFSYGLDLRERR